MRCHHRATGFRMNELRHHPLPLAVSVTALVICLSGALINVNMALTSYLMAWLFVLGLSLGALANLMLHALTGGRWGVPLYPALIAAVRLLPLLALLSIPLLVGADALYPWAGGTPGVLPAGKSWWLNRGFFIARWIAYLLIWNVLGALWLSAWRERNSPASGHRMTVISAPGLIVYGFTMSLAAVDWIASLVPQWKSSGFGLLVVTGQMLAAMAFGIVVAARQGHADSRDMSRQNGIDFGNLLLMYVMTWAYLAFTQFLIIWAENLPHEINWYVPRLQTSWRWLGVFLVIFHFFVPLLILLSRHAKRSPQLLGSLAVAVLVAHLADVVWLVLPSLRPHGLMLSWTDLAGVVGVGGVWWSAWRVLYHTSHAAENFEAVVAR
jgi:hypothetical protein